MKLKNGAGALAFFVHLTLVRGGGGAEVAPILWSDNYVSIPPGGERTVIARYAVADLHGAAPAIAIAGWNVAAQLLTGF